MSELCPADPVGYPAHHWIAHEQAGPGWWICRNCQTERQGVELAPPDKPCLSEHQDFACKLGGGHVGEHRSGITTWGTTSSKSAT